MAFGFNAMIGTALFGAIAVAREYGHTTVVPMFLTSPRRHRAVLAQLTAVLLAGAVLGLVGEAMIVTAVALALPSTEFAFLASAGDIIRLMAASMLAGMAGAVLGAGIGALIRNLGGAVTVTVLLLFIAPGMAVQLINESASWMPSTLLSVMSGVTTEVSVGAALLALAAWALLPAGAGLMAIQTTRRGVAPGRLLQSRQDGSPSHDSHHQLPRNVITMRPARIAALIVGCLLAPLAFALFLGGGALGLGYLTQRDADGYVTTDTRLPRHQHRRHHRRGRHGDLRRRRPPLAAAPARQRSAGDGHCAGVHARLRRSGVQR